MRMRKKKYISNWLSNTSVAAIIVGGFQQIDISLRLLALGVAIIFFILGYILDKGE